MEGSQTSYHLRTRRPINVLHAEKSTQLSIKQVRKTQPLRRHSGMKRGKCNELPRTPAKPKKEKLRTPKRSSAIKQRNIRIQSDAADTPTSVVIKTNPLFTQSSPVDHLKRLGAENLEGDFPGYHKVFRDPTRGRERKKTKDNEMISAILELAKYGEKRYGKKKLLSKVKLLGRKKGSSDEKHPRSPLSDNKKDWQQNTNDFYP